jgi:ATP-dependent exoDNAse (exonuclease V) beta subunit
MDNETEGAEEKVTIMTLHAAKGLEFPVIFLPGWEDGLFPSQRSMDETGLKGLEEERRLAYVGITRAEELCTISFASNRRVYGQWQSQLPSRFIDELPADHVEVLTAARAFTAAAMGRRLRWGSDRRWKIGCRRPMSTTRPAGGGCRKTPVPGRCGSRRRRGMW